MLLDCLVRRLRVSLSVVIVDISGNREQNKRAREWFSCS